MSATNTQCCKHRCRPKKPKKNKGIGINRSSFAFIGLATMVVGLASTYGDRLF